MQSLLNSNLHMHSFYSDGLHTPAELAELSGRNGFGLVSLTDHNSVSGLTEFASHLIMGKTHCIPGVEFSCGFDSEALGGSAVMHVLAYFPPQLHETSSQTSEFVEKRFGSLCRRVRLQINARRALQIGLIEEAGLNISFNEVFRSCLARSPADYDDPEITRDDIALALIRRNSIGVSEAKKLLSFNGRFYIGLNSSWVLESIEEVIETVKDFGGITSLAHPLKKIPERKLKATLIELKSLGIDAVEVLNKCSIQQAIKMAKIARELSLRLTYGNDFHGKQQEQTMSLDTQSKSELMHWLESINTT